MKKSTATLLRAALATTILATTACTTRTADPALTVISADNTAMRTDRGLVPDMIEDWDFARLETSPGSLLHGVWWVAIDEGLIFIYSAPATLSFGATAERIKVFDLAQGRYLRDIGVWGRGPGEYISIDQWTIDPENNRVIICDRDEVLTFDYQGNPLEIGPRGDGLDTAMNIAYLPDGNILGYDWLNGESRVQTKLMDGAFNVTGVLSRTGFALTDRDAMYGLLGTNWMSVHRGHVMVTKDFCDTIYTYAQGRLQPEIHLAVSRSMEGIAISDPVDYNDLRSRLKERGYDEKKMANVFETDDHYLFTNDKNSASVVWNKAAGRGVLLGENEKVSQVPLGTIVGTDGQWLIASVEAYEVLEYRDECARLGVEITPRMAALFDGLGEEDNPVLIKYRLKNELR